MLQELRVRNLALIEEEAISFAKGLNILTGETGAGKSILLGSVHLALGEKAPKDLLRRGADFALVELTFSVEEAQLSALQALDIYPQDGLLVLSRKLLPTGRSVCRINGETITLSLMQQVASLLLDIHGQHEHQSLLTKKNHIKYLDAYAARQLAEKKEALAEAFASYTHLKNELSSASLDEAQQKRELDFLQFEIDEIKGARLVEGEDEELESQFRRLLNGQKLMEAAAECEQLCSSGRGNAAEQIGRGLRSLLSVAQYDGAMEELSSQLAEIDALLNDFNRDFAGYIATLDGAEEALLAVEERLNIINRIKAKYGKTIPQIFKALAEKEAALETLLHYEEYRGELAKKLSAAEQVLARLSAEVSAIRKEAALSLTEELKAALCDLNFPQVQLSLSFEKLEKYTANGTDDVRFLVSTNPGEPIKPLEQVASGGELSRIMLGLKTVLAENDDIQTLIFDEIDSGISGRTAQMVAEKMKQTAQNHQVICITHLPQIAAMADAHYLIEKTAMEEESISRIFTLNREESILELARMLGGVRITERVLESAREMKELAEKISF